MGAQRKIRKRLFTPGEKIAVPEPKEGEYCVAWGFEDERVWMHLKWPAKGIDQVLQSNETFVPGVQGLGSFVTRAVDNLIALGVYKARERETVLGDLRQGFEMHGHVWESVQ